MKRMWVAMLVGYPIVVAAIVSALRVAARRPWWEDVSEEISNLPEVDPGDDPRGRPAP